MSKNNWQMDMKTHVSVEEGSVCFRQRCNVTVCLSEVFKMAAVDLDTQPGRYSDPTVPRLVASLSDGACLNRKYLPRLLVAYFPKSVYVTCQPFYAPAMHSAAGNRKAKSSLAL
jgi:hypothetical protein